MTIADAVREQTLQWHRIEGRRPGWELRPGDEVLALVTDDVVEIGDQPYRREAQKERIMALVEQRRGGVVATVRDLSSGPAVISAGSGRYRLSRQGVLPFAWEVTEDLGGPQILEILKLGSLVRVRAGSDVDDAPDAELELLVVLSGMRLLGALHPASPVAA